MTFQKGWLARAAILAVSLEPWTRNLSLSGGPGPAMKLRWRS
ncbi:hypothetical protein [Glycocaulis alkaliphilus]|nr:hypothetical protein [Glycocaulis alkaliphilus]